MIMKKKLLIWMNGRECALLTVNLILLSILIMMVMRNTVQKNLYHFFYWCRNNVGIALKPCVKFSRNFFLSVHDILWTRPIFAQLSFSCVLNFLNFYLDRIPFVLQQKNLLKNEANLEVLFRVIWLYLKSFDLNDF
jgi:hypothetical protein